MNNDQFNIHSQPFEIPRIVNPMNSRMNCPNPAVNKGTSNIFYKTKICTSLMAGNCSKGADCKYAHGMEDIRQPPPNWQDLAGLRGGEEHASGNWDDDQKIIYKMKLCKKFYNREECHYGERCNFLHEDPVKFRNDSESSAISFGTTRLSIVHGNGYSQSDANRLLNNCLDAFQVNTKRNLKTKTCNSCEKGCCHCGYKCHFAHGQSAIAPLLCTIMDCEGCTSKKLWMASAHYYQREAMSTGSIPILAKPQHAPLRDASPPKTVSLPTFTEEWQGKKCLLKWKGYKKIDRIYADWLDDEPLAHHLPGKV